MTRGRLLRRAAGTVGRAVRFLLLAGALSLFALTALFLVLDSLHPLDESALSPPPGQLVLDREGRALRFFPPPDSQRRMAAALEEISPRFLDMIVASEDRWYRLHFGVNPLAVARAAIQNLLAGEVVSGASTIPMQVARLADPRPRTLWAKCVEAFRAVQLTRRFSKDDLLEGYVNLLPFGSNLVGIRAASRAWFAKEPDQLSLAECALLTALPRSPAAYDPTAHPRAARRARDRVLGQLADRGAITEKESLEAMSRPLPQALRHAPFRAPHFSRLARALAPGQAVVRTTLDPAMQQRGCAILASHAGGLQSRGIDGAAFVVLDVATREVLALAGSPDFFDFSRQGQVDMATARRSPGSTLKPFLYGLAMDRGIISPDSYLLDVPTSYAGYEPMNYDETFQGRVTASQALKRSLNVPAVRLLARTGLESFHALLRKGGLSGLDRPALSYGLPLVLGACEASLLELTNLYACLADSGLHKPVHLFPRTGPAPHPGERLLSPEAAWLVAETLTDVARPEMDESWRLTRDGPAAAWKTGTSFGHRDAWAVGVTGSLAIGVWCGNPDGTPRKHISGAGHAAPLLFALIRGLARDALPLAPPPGLQIEELSVCAADRLLPTPECRERTAVRVIPEVTRLERSRAFERAFVDSETGLRVAGECLEGREVESRAYRRMEPELAAWMASQGAVPPGAPPMSPDCTAIEAGGPAILSPDPATPYRLRSQAPRAFQRIALRARTGGGSMLTWFQEGMVAARGKADEPLFIEAEPGTHRLAVVDDKGRMDAVTYTVEPAP